VAAATVVAATGATRHAAAARPRRAATTHARVRSATTGGGGDGGYVDVSDPKSEESVEFVPADDDSDGELRFPRVAADSATFGPAEARRAKLKRFLPLVAVLPSWRLWCC